MTWSCCQGLVAIALGTSAYIQASSVSKCDEIQCEENLNLVNCINLSLWKVFLLKDRQVPIPEKFRI